MNACHVLLYFPVVNICSAGIHIPQHNTEDYISSGVPSEHMYDHIPVPNIILPSCEHV